ncbi:MAG TPA: glycine cleavage system aminomethyltransferase GcvT [Candidatus Obscuribacterales bacterium]
MVATTLKETPLAAIHKKAGARMVDFAGWNMPVQYKSIIQEHMAVRTKVGLFDVSHMGEFLITGADAFAFVQYVIANDLQRLSAPNRALYTQFVNEHGGTVDDLIVYRRSDDFLMVVNASNIDKDWEWVNKHSNDFKSVTLSNASDKTALLALQGPHAVDLLSELVGRDLHSIPAFGYAEAAVDGIKISFGRTGYTGEDGFEIFTDAKDVVTVWEKIMKKGQSYGIEPCGLGARDTLRLEAGLPLYGHELDEKTSPLEAGLGWSVKLEKGEFVGREALKSQKDKGLAKQCVCLKVEGKALPRQGYDVLAAGQKIGSVTSGSQGIFVGYPIAFAFVPPEYAKQGQMLEVQIRDSRVVAHVVPRPWYKRSK